MVKIITVHGTNAGAESDEGDQWWQTGSAFQRRLQELIAEPLEFQPFHWSGANSEEERRKAAEKLGQVTKKLDKAGTPYGLIGHSHGGSVVVEMLRLANRHIFSDYIWGDLWKALGAKNDSGEKQIERKKNALGFWATIGSPLIGYKRFNFIQSFTVQLDKFVAPTAIFIFWGAMASAFIPIFIGMCALWLMVGTRNSAEIAEQVDPTVVDRSIFVTSNLPFIGTAIAFLSIVFYLLFAWRMARQQDRLATLRLKQKQIDRFKAGFEKKWISLWDKADEAINALQLSQGARVNITPPRIGVQAIATFLALLAVTGIFTAVHLFFQETPYEVYGPQEWRNDEPVPFYILRNFSFAIAEAIFGVVEGYFWFGVLTFTVMTIALGQFFTWPARMVSKRIAAFSNRTISALARNSAFGLDMPLLLTPKISTAPVEFDKDWAALPEAPSKAVHDYSNLYAASLVEKGRQVLGLAQMGVSNDELLRQLTETVTWNELIHTAYFEVDEFIKLLAYAITEQTSLTPSQAFLADADYARVGEWYAEIAPERGQ